MCPVRRYPVHPLGPVPGGLFREEPSMRVIQWAGVAAIALSLSAVRADDLKSGPEKKIGGAFDVKAVTGESKGKTFCYV